MYCMWCLCLLINCSGLRLILFFGWHSFLHQMFQVIQPERALYIQANNCVEARDWIDILTKVSQCNRKRLSMYHPSAYLNGHWLCCKMSADTAPGCTPCTGWVICMSFDRLAESHFTEWICQSILDEGSVCVFSSHSGLPANIQLDVDGDRETERIYSLYNTYMSKLVKMQGEWWWITHSHNTQTKHKHYKVYIPL